ncbi:MAG: hypothetical protein ACRD2D_09975 [Terriglobales bacterium]
MPSGLVPGPILAAWLGIATRNDLLQALTNPNPNDQNYKARMAGLSFSPADTAQWNTMVANLQPSDLSFLAGVGQLWHQLTASGSYFPICPPDTQLETIAHAFPGAAAPTSGS